MQTITIEKDGKEYKAIYTIIGDTLTVTLPDHTQCETELRGLDPELAAEPHLRGYIRRLELAKK